MSTSPLSIAERTTAPSAAPMKSELCQPKATLA